MSLDTALPTAEPTAQVSEQQPAALDQSNTEQTTEQTEQADDKPKPEKTPEQLEIARLQRGLNRRTRQLYELRAASTPQPPSPQEPPQRSMPASQGTDEPVTLSRAELQAMVKQEAERLAPSIRQQQTEMEHRAGVVKALAKEWGTEKFDAMSAELESAFDGLVDAHKRPKPAVDAIFESEAPRALIEYLADPDNADEAEALGRMSAIQAGRAIGKLETKLQAKAKDSKPQRSNAPAPIEPVRGGGTSNRMPDPSDTKAYMKWANEAERRK